MGPPNLTDTRAPNKLRPRRLKAILGCGVRTGAISHGGVGDILRSMQLLEKPRSTRPTLALVQYYLESTSWAAAWCQSAGGKGHVVVAFQCLCGCFPISHVAHNLEMVWFGAGSQS